MFGRQIYFKTVSHIEYLVHLCPVRIALLFNRFEQRRNREQIILNHAAIVTYKVQHFRLCTTRAVYHTVNFRAKCIQQLLHYRCIRAGRGEYQFACIQRAVFYGIRQFQTTGVNQFFGHCLVITFGIFLCQIFGEYIMTGAGQSVAAHTTVIFLFISSLSVRSQAYNYIARTDIGIINHIAALHAASYGAVHDDGTHQIAYIGSFTACSIYAYTHFAELGEQFVRSVDDGGDNFSRNEKFVASDGRRNQDIIYCTYAEQVVDIHNQCILCNAFPNRKITCFFPVHISQ